MRTVVEAKARSAAEISEAEISEAEISAAASAAEGATAGVGAPCAEDLAHFRPPPFPAQTPPIINT